MLKIIVFCSLMASSLAIVLTPTYVTAPRVAVAAPAISYATYTPIRSVVAHAPIAVAHAPVVAHAPIAAVAKPIRLEPVDPNPAYSFSYGVHDPTTGDSKQQSEQLQNGVVEGSYSVDEPDGTRRTVHYTADSVNGFNAVVNKEPSKLLAAKVVAAPAVAVAHAPVATIVHH